MSYLQVLNVCFSLIVHCSGEYGMGTMANELSLGCDCLGQIHYLVSEGHLFNKYVHLANND